MKVYKMKKSVILTAAALGFFRSKDAEKQLVIFEEMMLLEEFATVSRETINGFLEAEIIRRHVVYQNRQQKAFDKIESDAAKPLTGGMTSAVGHIEKMPAGKYVLTVAQNNTEVNQVFFGALKNFCNDMGAQLLIAKMTYNKNGFQSDQAATDGVYYAKEVLPYLVEGQIDLGGKIHFCAQANVLPTAKNPLTGFESITGVGVGVVIPASKIALKCTAALKGGKNKVLFATGAVTLRNYIMRKAGAVAATEHSIGALYVEVSETGDYIARQLELMEGSDGFYDNGSYFTADTITTDQSPLALQFGDIHAEKMESCNLAKMNKLIDYFKPHNIICHDVMDFSSRNHHNIKDCAFMFAQEVNRNTVKQDIITTVKVIDSLARGYNTIHIIESNHDLAINTWLKNTDFKEDPVNAVLYLQCMHALYSHIEETKNSHFNMLQYVYDNVAEGQTSRIYFHDSNESVVMAGVEMGCHGHHGSNGSRGSPSQFRALGIMLNTGHTHTPSILGGCYTAGVTGSLYMGYNENGASSWALANILTWPNGQRQVIFM